ncbi:MAG TPA: hypothetical protein VHC72_10990, partial [Bryobacteraceae bacterium]|nr:hypothetical protein [Bryobacteraceae bacterium]
ESPARGSGAGPGGNGGGGAPAPWRAPQLPQKAALLATSVPHCVQKGIFYLTFTLCHASLFRK